MPTVVTLSPEDQIPLPAEVKDRLGVHSGDRLEFLLGEDGSIRLRSAGRSVARLEGIAEQPRHKLVSDEQIRESIVEHLTQEDERIRSGH